MAILAIPALYLQRLLQNKSATARAVALLMRQLQTSVLQLIIAVFNLTTVGKAVFCYCCHDYLYTNKNKFTVVVIVQSVVAV